MSQTTIGTQTTRTASRTSMQPLPADGKARHHEPVARDRDDGASHRQPAQTSESGSVPAPTAPYQRGVVRKADQDELARWTGKDALPADTPLPTDTPASRMTEEPATRLTDATANQPTPITAGSSTEGALSLAGQLMASVAGLGGVAMLAAAGGSFEGGTSALARDDAGSPTPTPAPVRPPQTDPAQPDTQPDTQAPTPAPSTPSTPSSPEPAPAPSPGPAPVPSPAYPAQGSEQTALHERAMLLESRLFAGSDAATAPEYIRITQLNPINPVPDAASLVLNAGTPQAVVLQPGAEIHQDDFGKLTWDASANDGGSLSFIPLDAGRQPIAGSAQQTITLYESPLPTDYPARQTIFVAHDGTSTIDAGVFSGAGTPPSHIRITSITPASPDAGSNSGLYLDHDGDSATAPTPLSTDQAPVVIAAADFGRLSWNAAANAGGSFRFEPMFDAQHSMLDPTSGQPVQQVVTLQELSPPPVYPTQSRAEVAHDKADNLLPRETFAGIVPAGQPQAVRIIDISPTGGNATESPLYYLDENSQRVTLQAGDNIAAGLFDKVLWDAGLHEGGSFRFQPVGIDGADIAGIAPQTVIVREHPAAPTYAANLTIYNLAYNSVVSAIPEHLSGTGTPAEYIVFQKITTTGAADDDIPVTLNGQPVAEGDVVRADDFRNLSWDARKNSGGSIVFSPALEDGTVILGSTPQTMLINEHPLPPVYPKTPVTVAAPHDGTGEIQPYVLNGTDPQRQPSHVRIISIQPTGHVDGTTVMQLDTDGDGPATPTPVRSGDVIDMALLNSGGRLTWNTAGNEGGRFTFVSTLSDGVVITGSNDQTITITEHPPAPSYTPQDALSVPKDEVANLAPELFSGTRNPPAMIRITGISLTGGLDPQATLPLFLNQGEDSEALLVNSLLDAISFGNVRWDTSNNSGGHFEFEPLMADGTPIAGATTQRITIHEQADAPVYAAGQAAIHAGYNQPVMIERAIFEGTDNTRRPFAIRITAVDEPNDIAPDASALQLVRDGATTAVTAGTTITVADFDRLRWDTGSTTGGGFTFQAVDHAGHPVPDVPEQTVRIVEEAQAADAQAAEAPLHELLSGSASRITASLLDDGLTTLTPV